MKSRRNVVAVIALLAILQAGSAAADWSNPGGDSPVPAMSLDDMVVAAQWGFQILQVAL